MDRPANEKMNSSKALPDERELVAFDGRHISEMSDHDLAVIVAPMLVDAGVTSKYWLETRWVYLRSVIGLLKNRVSRMSDFVSLGGYFFFFDRNYDAKAEAELLVPESGDLLAKLATRFAALEQFTLETTSHTFGVLAREQGIEEEKLAKLTRLAVSGNTDGPGLFDSLVLLSQPIVVERLKKAVDYIRAKRKL